MKNVERNLIVKLCADCGGSNVVMKGVAYWNIGHQCWEFEKSHPPAYCDDCGAGTYLIDGRLDDFEVR